MAFLIAIGLLISGFMPEVERPLLGLLQSFGYSASASYEAGGRVYANLTGSLLKEATAVFRSDNEVCVVGIIVGVLDAVPESQRYGLLINILELNFHNPLAQAGILRVPSLQSSGPEDAPATKALIAETSTFRNGLTKEKFDTRAKALCAMAEAVSSLLAVRQALPDTNPFASRLRISPPPRGRTNFPDPPTPP